MAQGQIMMKKHLLGGATTPSPSSSRETRDALYALMTLGQWIQREAEGRLYGEVTLRTSAELAAFHKTLVDGKNAERSASVHSFTLDWPEGKLLSAMDLVHLACILCRLTAVARLELPVACGSNSIFDYEFDHAAPDVQTLLPPTMFLDLFERMRPLGHLRALDVTLELLVRIPSEALQQVACLSLRIEGPEQPRACEAVTRLSGQNLQSLRILRKCHGQVLGPQESPARLCAALNVTGLTYLELRDIDVEGANSLGSVDRVANTMEAEDAVHMVPSLTTIVWEPAWVRSYSKGDPSYQKMVQEYLLDLLDIFGEALVVLREDDTSAQIMGRHTEGSVELTQVPIEERWWELDSWGELWLEVIRTVDSWGELWLEVLRTVGNCV